MLVSLLPASGLRLHIGRSINTDRRAGSNRPPERAQCNRPVGTGPTWTGFRKREHPRSLKNPQRPETLGVLKSPGSNESQGGGGLKLLPGAIGPDLVVSHSRVLQLQGTYEDSENGSICFRSAAKRPSIPQPGKKHWGFAPRNTEHIATSRSCRKRKWGIHRKMLQTPVFS